MNQVIAEILINILIALAGLIAAYALYFIKKVKDKVIAETAKIKDEQQRDLLREAFWQLEELVGKAVGAMEETTARELRKQVKAGVLDRQSLVELSKKVYVDVIAKMIPEYETALENEIYNAREYIMDCIENRVLEVKALSNKLNTTHENETNTAESALNEG